MNRVNQPSIDIRRRRLLAGGAGLFTASALGSFVHPTWSQPKPLPHYVDWKNGENLIMHLPTTIETERHVFAQRLILNNLPSPGDRRPSTRC